MRPITKDTILQNLQIIYWHARNNNKLDIALQAVEQTAQYMGLFEKQSPPSQRLPQVRRTAAMTAQQPRDFMAAQGVEQQAQYAGVFEKQSVPSQRLPEVMRLQDMTEGQLRDFIGLEKLRRSLKELGPELAHPPP